MTSEPDAAPNAAHGPQRPFLAEWQTLLWYSALASLWTIGSDMVLDSLHQDPIDSPRLQLHKGVKFMVTFAVVLFMILPRSSHRVRLAEKSLQERRERFGFTDAGQREFPGEANAGKNLLLPELGIVLAYLLIASLWMVCSDVVLDSLNKDPIDSLQLQIFKGLGFVATTALLLFLGLRHGFRRWRQAERRLREGEERFQLAGRAASDAIWDWTLGTDAVWWSDSFYRLFGYEREEVSPTREAWSERIHPEDKNRTLADLQTVLLSHEPIWAAEYRFRRQDGTYAFVAERAYVIRDAAGKAVRVVGGMTDITARKEAEEKLERSRRQLRSLSARLESLREEERTRIAREIHDELGQTLTGLKMDLRWVEKHLARVPTPALNPILDKIVESSELVDATIHCVQRIASELRPGVLEHLGLIAALQREAGRFQERTGVRCQLHTSESIPALPPDVAMAVFRIFQESLTNVARHAESTEVEVHLVHRAERLVLRIVDNGKGIPSSDLEDAKSIGLLGMKERAHSVGGELILEPLSPRGTAVVLTLPLSRHVSPALETIP